MAHWLLRVPKLQKYKRNGDLDSLDKYEYRLKAEQIEKLVKKQEYKTAARIADTIDWRRVKNLNMLYMVAEIYETMKRYEDCMEILNIAYDHAPVGRIVLYKMTEIATKMHSFEDAIELYKEFVKAAPHDQSRYILKYQIYRERGSSLDDQIAILKDYKTHEYQERWAYELASLYSEAGMAEECVRECDELILWFSEGEYVIKAMELKMQYEPLTAAQQEKYDHRMKGNESRVHEDDYDDAELPSVDTDKFSTMNLQAELAANLGELLKEDSPKQPQKPEISRAEHPKEPEVMLEELDLSELTVPELSVPELDVPELSVPELDVPELTVPELTVPEPDASGEPELPEEELPIELESLEIPDIELPVKQEMPVAEKTEEPAEEKIPEEIKEEEPEISEPEIEDIPEPAAEREKTEAELIAELDVPEIGLPESLKVPEVEIAEPKLDVPEIKAEEPELCAPEIEAVEPELELPEIKTVEPELELPEIELPEDPMIEKQITGQLTIDDVLAEWENKRARTEAILEANAEKEQIRKEKVNQETTELLKLISGDTGTLPDDVKKVLEEIDREKEIIDAKKTAKETVTEDDLPKDLDVPEVQEYEEEELISFEDLDAPEEAPVIKKSRVSGDTASMNMIQELERALAAEVSEMAVNEGHLTKEQARLFAYFTSVKGMSKQLSVLFKSDTRVGRTNSSKGNLVVTGKQGNGKTTLAIDIVKALQKQKRIEGKRLAKISGKKLNTKDIYEVISKLKKGALIIESAGGLSDSAMMALSLAMEGDTGGLLVILEDSAEEIQRLFRRNKNFASKFDHVIDIPVFTNDELVAFGKSYAMEQEYVFDNFGVLALYNQIGNRQTNDHLVTVAEVKDIIDAAIAHSEKGSIRHFIDRVTKKSVDEFGNRLLREEDFE